jgi:predicted RNA-binding Zn-ribbon protein involved in translation (DUF1610 family)
MNEIDIPCSDCGSAVVERTVTAGDVGTPAMADRSVTVAECPDCGARYYPEETLTRLTVGDPT